MTARKRRRAGSRNSLGSIEKLPSGKYRARYFRDGAEFKAPHTFPSKTAAQDWLAAEYADRSRGVWHDPRLGRENLADYARAWLDTRPDLAARTLSGYRRQLDSYILPRVGGARGVELGRLELGQITPATVRTWRAALLTDVRARVAARAKAAKPRTHPARAWALAQGLEVKPTGQFPRAVLAAWVAAGRPTAGSDGPQVEDASRDVGRTTVENAYRVLRAVLNTAVHDGLLASNPCQIRGAGIVHAAERPTASPAVLEAIAQSMPTHLAAAVPLAAWSGLRFGELFGLARQHVDLEAGTVRVDRALVCVPGEPVRFGQPKTRSSRRTVHLPGFVVEVLRAHMAEHVPPGATSLLFTTVSGEPVTTARLAYAYQRARAAAGRPDLRWHDLRHTGATLAYSTGASVREVQNRLGHSTMRAAAIYAHAADDSDQILAKRLDALYGTAPAHELPKKLAHSRAA